MEQQRIVKGIWIPIEIWKDKNLSWNEKILFLEIDSYTSKEQDCFFSNEYIANLLGISETNANKTLSSLISKGYVVKTKFDGRRRYIKSALSISTTLPCQEQQVSRARVEDYNNTTDRNNNKTDYSKEEDTNVSPKKRRTIVYTEDFEKAFALTGRKGSKKNAFVRWQAMSEEDKQKAMIHIPFYYKSNDRRYLKDFEGYLNGRYYDSVVYDKEGRMVFDPDKLNGSIPYAPQTNTMLFWNDYYKCYIYIGNWSDGDKMWDGYNDEDRPDGAAIMLNNGRGTIMWDKKSNKWINNKNW